MKGIFDGQNERLAEVLKNHDPYVVITVSTTGLDRRPFSDHRPTAVVVQEYVYSDEDKKYNEGITYNELVKCSPKALQNALDSIDKGGYDVFTNSGIDKNAYVRGDNVRDTNEVRAQLSQIFGGMHPNAVYIANNIDHCIKYLDRIGCADFLKDQLQNHNLLDQPSLSRQFFQEHNVDTRKATLESLREYLNNAENYMRTNGIERFSDVDPVKFSAYDASHKTTASLTSGAAKVNVVNQFVQFKGRELDYLTQLNEREAIETENEVRQSWSESGKAKYRSADFEAKLDTLFKKGVLTQAMLSRDSETDLNAFYDAIEGKTSVKGAVFFQAATTGFTAGNKPIQFTAICVGMENGKLAKPIEKISFNIEADSRDVQTAIDLAKKGQYDTFARAKIDVDKYLAGDYISIDEAARRIGEFFQKYGNDYLLLSNGTGKDGKAYTVSCLSSVGNFGLDRKKVLDVADIIKQYCCVAHYDKSYKHNAILDESTWANKGFGLEDFANARGKEIDGTQAKVILMGTLLSEIGEQQHERVFGKPEIPQSKEQPAAKAPEKDNAPSAGMRDSLKPQEKNEKPFRVIVYSKDKDEFTMVGEKGETDNEKMRFLQIADARRRAQQELESRIEGYEKDPKTALATRCGYAIFNENELTLETRGTIPVERVFDKKVLEINGLIDKPADAGKTATEPPKRETFPAPQSQNDGRFIEENGYKNVREAIGNVSQTTRPTAANENREVERRYNAEQRRPQRTFPNRERRSPDAMRPIRHSNDAPTTIVINAFGGAGAGKTTACMHIASELKKRGYTVEYVPEYAKDLVYDNPSKLDGSFGAQQEIFAEQQHRLDRVIGKADFVVTDAPLLLQSLYLKDCPEKAEFDKAVTDKFKTYNNFCFVVKRDENSYQQEGRMQSFEEAKQVDAEIVELLKRNELYFGNYTHDSIGIIVDNALKSFGRLCPERRAEIANEIAEHSKASEYIAPTPRNDKNNDALQTALTSMTEMMKTTVDLFTNKTTELMTAMMEQNKMFADQFQTVMKVNNELLRENRELTAAFMAMSGQQPDMDVEKKQMRTEKPSRP